MIRDKEWKLAYLIKTRTTLVARRADRVKRMFDKFRRTLLGSAMEWSVDILMLVVGILRLHFVAIAVT